MSLRKLLLCFAKVIDKIHEPNDWSTDRKADNPDRKNGKQD